MKFTDFVPVPLCSLSSEQAAALDAMFDCRSPEALNEIALNNYSMLRSLEAFNRIPNEQIMQISIMLVFQLLRNMGGGSIYLPNGFGIRGRERDAQIAKEFNGDNVRTLAKKYGVTEMRVRQILYETGAIKRPARRTANML
jgi:Mor family transcriptional regulator